ncbi:MAG: o-succinylbenzoate synthase [Candidatus Sericytochromatia bacterium]
MFKASYKKINLQFNFEAKTSRGSFLEKDAYFLFLQSLDNPNIYGIGEASPIKDLSIDNLDDFEKKIALTCQEINKIKDMPEDLELAKYPAIEFALETAILDLQNGGIRKIVDTDFFNKQKSISINGLVWMDSKENMKEQIKNKIENGFKCIKIKVGSLSFEDELDLLKEIRKNYPKNLEIRLDANGAFAPKEALEKLKKLSEYNIHSIEQPIKQGNWGDMAKLAKNSPIPIALDEELIGISTLSGKGLVLDIIKPKYIILKPTLLGGLQASQEWIELAHDKNIDWWVTSSLESNIGLNAIAQWTSSFNTILPQGLGTGQIYKNNIDSPLEVKNGALSYNKNKKWGNLIN